MARRKEVSAGAIVLREIAGELKIALAHRKNGTKEWVLPKGHVDAGETIEQAALREVEEETGLAQVQLIKHLGTTLRRSTKGNGDEMSKTIHYYLAYALDDGLDHAPSDSRFKGVGWFSPVQAIELLPYEEERVFLKAQLAPMFKV